MNSLEKADFWLKKLQNLGPVINGVEPTGTWSNEALAGETLARVCENFKKDLEGLENEAKFMFSRHVESERMTEKSENLF